MKKLLVVALITVMGSAFAASTPGQDLSAIKCPATLASDTRDIKETIKSKTVKEVKEVKSTLK